MKTEPKTETAEIVAEEASEKKEASTEKKAAKTKSKTAEKESAARDSAPKARKKAGALFLVSETALDLDNAAGKNSDTQELIIKSSILDHRLDSHFNVPAGSFSDAKLLLLPARTMRGSFAWCTTAEILNEFRSTYLGTSCGFSWEFTAPTRGTAFCGAENSCRSGKRVLLEEFAFKAEPLPIAGSIGRWISLNAFPLSKEFAWWRAKVTRDVVILNSEDFSRIARCYSLPGSSSTKYPRETLFYAKPNDSILSKSLELTHLFIGNRNSLGEGLVQLRMLKESKYSPAKKRKKPTVNKAKNASKDSPTKAAPTSAEAEVKTEAEAKETTAISEEKSVVAPQATSTENVPAENKADNKVAKEN